MLAEAMTGKTCPSVNNLYNTIARRFEASNETNFRVQLLLPIEPSQSKCNLFYPQCQLHFLLKNVAQYVYILQTVISFLISVVPGQGLVFSCSDISPCMWLCTAQRVFLNLDLMVLMTKVPTPHFTKAVKTSFLCGSKCKILLTSCKHLRLQSLHFTYSHFACSTSKCRIAISQRPLTH